MPERVVKVAIGKTLSDWDQRFAEALEARKKNGYPLDYRIMDLDQSDWREALEPYDLVVWKADAMGPRAAAQFAAKIHFLETYARKIVAPSFKTIWHFENKIAQSYLLKHCRVPVPSTFVSFDYHDAKARLENQKFPIVLKAAHGAASQKVRLVKTRGEMARVLENVFCQQLYREAKTRCGSPFMTALRSLGKYWLWRKAWRTLVDEEIFDSIYWQDFVPQNPADLRITVIGDRHAFGFWRKNRPNDFRASGSGRLDYETPIPENPLRFCLSLNQRLGFDSMAYDIIFDEGRFLVTEISYGYLDTAIHNAKGHWELGDGGEIRFLEGHCWPEALWVDWALRRAERELDGPRPSQLPGANPPSCGGHT